MKLIGRVPSLNKKPMFIDTHCHLDFPEFNSDRNEAIQRAKDKGVEYIINIGSSLEGSRKSLELAKQYDFIRSTVGLHPHEADKFDVQVKSTLGALARDEKTVAVGEIGLDYYKNYSQSENQKTVFISLLKLAKDMNLPVVIHNRQAQEDILAILKEFMPIKAVVHCFSGDQIFLKECLESHFFISFTCNVTYKKATNLRNLVKITPLDRLLLETDAPFLPPQAFRGRRNEPAYIKILAEEIAKIKEIGVDEIARVTTQNALNFFKLK